jgi:hypothetical protein
VAPTVGFTRACSTQQYRYVALIKTIPCGPTVEGNSPMQPRMEVFPGVFSQGSRVVFAAPLRRATAANFHDASRQCIACYALPAAGSLTAELRGQRCEFSRRQQALYSMLCIACCRRRKFAKVRTVDLGGQRSTVNDAGHARSNGKLEGKSNRKS